MPEELTDQSPMPFGKHKDKKMEDVSASYLHWFYHNADASTPDALAVRQYIRTNMAALKMETKNLIWD